MSQVESAIEAGRCSLAVSGALLRDADVMLALTERGALSPMALAGPAQAPVVEVGDAGVARAIGQPGGVLAIVDPDERDQQGLSRLASLVSTAPHKPAIVVVAKKYNQLQFAMMFRGLKIEHVKDRGNEWVKRLPVPAVDSIAEVPEVPKAKDRRKQDDGPVVKFAFVGRDEELAALGEHLKTGGPIVVSGPRGVGRTWLIEHAIAASGLTRLPDLTLAHDAGADTLFARLAEIARAGGSDRLVEVLQGEHTPPQAVAAAIEALQAASGTEGQVMVIDDLQIASGKTGDFFRKSRLELLIEALLTNTYPLRLVFTSVIQPVFFREGRDAPLRRLELAGLKGRFYHEVFQAYQSPEFPRDRFGPISEKLHGHAFAVRTYAVACRHDERLSDDEKFFRMDGVDDVGAVLKQIEKRIERLADGPRRALAWLAHLRVPVDGKELGDLQINRKLRNHLIAEGLLDMVGTAEDRRYVVHAIVRRALDRREASDFRTFAELGGRYAQLAQAASGVQRLALQQEANRCMIGGRRLRDVVKTELPDHDALLDASIGLLRAREPRFDMAAERIQQVLKADPSNADAHLLKLELLRRQDAPHADRQAALDDAIAQAPVPEVFHEGVAWHLSRNARNKAIKVLETAIEVLPDQSRLRTRLAALLLRAGRRPEAIEHLQRAMELDPMLPDAYGLLGMARREEGTDRLDEAETLLREAVRLNPTDVVQVSRLISLLLDVAKGVPERADAARAEIKELLDGLLEANKDSWEVHALYAEALRESGGDLDRAAWFLKKAKTLAPRRRTIEGRFDLDRALLDLASGKLDEAERRLLGLAKKDPTNHRIFAGIARVNEARGQLVAAHAEFQRAAERTSPHSLARQGYEQELARLQALITAGGGLVTTVPAEALPVEVLERGDDELAPYEEAEGAPDGEPEAEPDEVAPVVYEAAEDEAAPADDEPAPADDEADPA